MHPIRLLLTGAIDYAGLFPPAALDLAATARNYAAYRAGDDGWALGRLVVPADRLTELESAADGLFPAPDDPAPWRVAALLSGDLETGISHVLDFNRRHAKTATEGAAIVDTIELKATARGDIRRATNSFPDTTVEYIEIPLDPDPDELLEEIGNLGLRAKIRTGGVTPELFPAPERVIRFLAICAKRKIAFKATAGLHHPIRAEYPLTYEPGSVRGTMYGYLNLFLADAFLRAGLSSSDAVEVLTETDPAAFTIEGDGIAWRGQRLDAAALARARTEGMTGFGSCSFTEPLDDARALGLLPAGA